jgi:penicillin-binding protein 1A
MDIPHVPLCLKPQFIAPLLQSLPYEYDLHPLWLIEVHESHLAGVDLQDGIVHQLGPRATDWARLYLRTGDRVAKAQSLKRLLSPGDVVYRRKLSSGEWILSQWPKVQGALVAIHPDGAIVAMQGGYNAHYHPYNHVIQAWRQPGSAIKPFIYAAALDKGYTLASTIDDAPVVIEDSGENFLWRPHNDNHTFVGMTRLREGLIHSRNLVSIRLLQAVGVPDVRQYLKQFGFHLEYQPKTLSLALGAGVVTPMMLTEGYAVFANQGIHTKPFLIEAIKDYHGHVIEAVHQRLEVPYRPRGERVLSPQIAFLMSSALQDVIQHGTGRAARYLNRTDLAGKTGTTNDRQDAWFSGFHPNLVTTVWLGFDDHRPLHGYGAQLALPIWIHFMQPMLKSMPVAKFIPPPGIVRARIDSKTGLLANNLTKNSMFEYFCSDHLPSVGKVGAKTEKTQLPEESHDQLF